MNQNFKCSIYYKIPDYISLSNPTEIYVTDTIIYTNENYTLYN